MAEKTRTELKSKFEDGDIPSGQDFADHIIHRIGAPDFPEIRRAIISSDDTTKYEEVAIADIRPYTEAEYSAKVEELIRQRYTASDELALINNVMAGVTEKRKAEYDAYQDYRAECKLRAKEALTLTTE